MGVKKLTDAYINSEKGYKRGIMVHSIIRFIVCIILTIICLFPLFIIVINATRSTNEIIDSAISFVSSTHLFDNFKTLSDSTVQNGFYTDNFNVWIGYRNSLIIAVSSTVLSVFFSALTAYGLTIYEFKLKKFATTFVLAVMMIPTQVVSVGFLQFMLKLKLYDNYLPLILPSIAAPSVVFFMLQYMKSSFPVDIVEAARIDGCGEFRTFLQIALPIFKPAFAVQAIFAFVASWNNFYTPNMLLINNKFEQRTMPMMVAGVMGNLKLSDYGLNYLVIVLSILPVVIVYLCLSKFIVKGVALGAVKG